MKQFGKIGIIFLGLSSLWTHAQTVKQITQFEQESREQRHIVWKNSQQKWLNKKQYRRERYDNDINNASIECLDYVDLHFRGVNEIDHRPFIPSKGECLNEARLNQLSRDLTAAYLKKGILHAPFQFETNQPKRLVMVVKEGRLKQVSSESKRLNFAMLLPNKQGKILTIQDLDQAIDQANKMRGSQVSVDVLPESNGNINLVFVNQEKRVVRGSVGLNNFAAKNYQRWQGRGSVSVDNPFGFSDNLNLHVSHTLSSFSRYSRSASLFYSIPYGYWSLTSFASFSQFRQQLTLPSSKIEQKGRTVQGSLGLDYVAVRGSNFVTTASAQLERIDTKNRFADAVLVLQSPNLSSYQFALNHLQILPNGAFSANLAYKHGLPWFNALPNQGKDQPEGQFAKWVGELYLQYHSSWFGHQFKHTHHLQGQYSRNYLVGIEQADLTGRNAVRGLNELGVSAEKSAVLRNQLSWLQQRRNLNWSPYIALDLGVVKTSEMNASSQKAIGYAIGLQLEQTERWNALLEWASGKLKTDNFSPSKRNQHLDMSIEVAF